MTTGGVDALKAAIRRSLPLLIGLIVLGIIAVNVFQQARGARYEATSKVLVTSTPLTSIISGTQPGFVDPERVQQTAIGIAESSEVYRVAAARNHQQHGSAGDLQSAVSVSADTNNDLISFTASSSDPEEAVGMANAVARGYIGFRKRLAGAQIADTIKGLKESLDQLPSDDPKRSRVEGNLSRLQVLQDNASDSQLVESATSAGKTSPAPLKDSVVGLSIGLIIGLLLIAIREAVAGRTLDEVLSAKAALDAELRDYVRARVAESGVEVTELGVKDVILPGEIRELVNKVVEAERVAKANLIRRQEETAATRSLLNTARLMEENPLLLRLKELESLERLVEKVGRIDLHAGNGEGLDALLTRLVRLKAPESA